MEIPDSLKAPNFREPGRRLHILVMNDGGGTRRFSLSTSFLWTLASLAILILMALGVLSYLASSLLVDNRSLQTRYDFELRRLETQAYNRSVPDSPEAAGRLLDRLDRAAMSAGESDQELPQGVPEVPAVPEARQAAAPPAPAPDPPAGQEARETAAAQGASPAGLSDAPPGLAGDPAVGTSPPAAGDGGEAAAAPAGPEEVAWTMLHNRLTMPPGPVVLDVDEFRFSPDGSYTYYLKRAEGPGERVKGRAVTVFAVADRGGNVKLVPDPELDLRNPSQGWDLGGRYNMMASKVYKGRISIPSGGEVRSAEILAWDEETKELIFLKRVPLDGGD
ncbi:MAG: hypothetical protein LBQ79_13035 [Deltaproteobacteria bacterium]|nr:hypothetical protein [Deltaproteobacteria bacterium]